MENNHSKPASANFKCDACGQTFEDDTEAVALYECGKCSLRFTQETSADGSGHRCPDCNVFGAKVSEAGCPECNEGILEQEEGDTPTTPAPCNEAQAPEPDLKQSARANPATQFPARNGQTLPVGSRDLERAELSVVASAIVCGNDPLPPTTSRLITFAPDSFRDLRLGKIAVTLRSMRASGAVIDFDRVGAKADELLFVLETLPVATLHPDLAEQEAQIVMAAFKLRGIQSVSEDMRSALESSPDKMDAILDGAIASLTSLRQSANGESLADKLAARQYDPDAHLERPQPRYSIGNVPVATSGNLTIISAAVKNGKTAAKGAMESSTFAQEDADCFGFNSQNPHGHAVIDVDTEQCPFDHAEINRTIAKRAGRPLPSWLKSYCLTGWTANDIRKAIPILLEQAQRDFGGVHSLFIDGVADAVHDVNDPAESNGFVAELHALAIQFDCTIVCVIHLNPGHDFKTRGHLGSQLERKAETNLKLEKDDEIVTLWADKNRHAPIPKRTAPRFAWNPEAGMHTSVISAADAKDQMEHNELAELAEQIFFGRPAMSFTDCVSTIKATLTVSDATAIRKLKRCCQLGVIRKTVANLYERKT